MHGHAPDPWTYDQAVTTEVQSDELDELGRITEVTYESPFISNKLESQTKNATRST